MLLRILLTATLLLTLKTAYADTEIALKRAEACEQDVALLSPELQEAYKQLKQEGFDVSIACFSNGVRIRPEPIKED